MVQKSLIAWLVPALYPLAGCHIETQGLTDLVATGPSYVNFPGTRLANGPVRRISSDAIRGTSSQQSRLLIQLETAELMSIDPDTLARCSMGLVEGFQAFASTDLFQDLKVPAVALLTDRGADGRGSLSFSNWDCHVWSTGLTHAELPNIAPSYHYPIRVTTDTGEALYAVDPWAQTTSLITENLKSLAGDPNRGWFSHEGDDWVVRNLEWDAIAEWSVDGYTIAFAAGFASLNAGILTAYQVDAGAVTVADDVCGVMGGDAYFLDGWPWRMTNVGKAYSSIAFFQPCSTRTLQLLQQVPGQTTSRTIGVPGQFTDPLVSIPLFAGAGYVLDNPIAVPGGRTVLGTGADTMYLGTLYDALSLASDAEPAALAKIGERALLPNASAGSGFLFGSDMQLVLVDYDGDVGRLIEWSPGAGARDIATNVRELRSGLALVDWDGAAGTLLIARSDSPILTSIRLTSLSNLQLGIPDGGRGPSAVWLDPTGALEMVHCNDCGWATVLTLDPEIVSTDTQPGSYGWFGSNILGYLHGNSSGVGTLSIRFIDSGDTFHQGGVSRVRFNSSSGVVYETNDGANTGTWYAQFR